MTDMGEGTNLLASMLGLAGAVLATSTKVINAAAGLVTLLIAICIVAVVHRHEQRIKALEAEAAEVVAVNAAAGADTVHGD